MKKNYLLMILSVLCLFTFFISCAQDELNAHKTEKDQEILNNSSIQVVDGYLSFADDNVFKNYLTALQENANELFITRAVTNAWPILGFTSIASLQNKVALTRSSIKEDIEDMEEKDSGEEMTEDEFNIMNLENLLPDPILTEVLDTTLRIKISDRIYRITKYGTFSALSENSEYIDKAIAKFDTTLIHKYPNGEYVLLENEVTFTNSFGGDYLEEQELDFVETDLTTRATENDGLNLHSGYDVDTYRWRNHSVAQRIFDKLRGKDVYREKSFDKNHRVQLEIFNINYAFYASAGIKLKMQKRKRFGLIKYWVSDRADKLAVGFNKVYGTLKYTSPTSYSSICPSPSNLWDKFTASLNGINTEFVYHQYHKLKIVKDWVDDIYMFLPKMDFFVELGNNLKKIQYPTISTMKKLYDSPAKSVGDFLKEATGKYISTPIKKQIQPKDPRISYMIWGESEYTFDKVKPYIMGVQEYPSDKSKTVRFDQSWGFSVNNGAVSGFLPSEFKITEIDAFGAAYYNGEWKGVRFIN